MTNPSTTKQTAQISWGTYRRRLRSAASDRTTYLSAFANLTTMPR